MGAEQFTLEINKKYVESTADMENLSNDFFSILSSGEMCGKVTVIAWSHSYMPELAQKLGCGPLQGCPLSYDSMEYDEVWSLKYVYKPNTSKLIKGEEYENLNNKQSFVGSQGWELFGSKVKQGFDPLRYSTEVGDYDAMGVRTGGRWMVTEAEL